ncbi:DUF2752 domain-containing protein [Hyalangium rubrum]|uniref:DUF2752 domain-containing protein n=1 Tax=Hyalangium rubrum TaxID=3103134 RepID=A0ABU5H8T9_9BACT|nr:DUF2752 domain-containing protein [Hyalangium sp. s54d21]MDY7229182.1 DUF2752 domain-containing protein [Hyalangium sp. s54d21]
MTTLAPAAKPDPWTYRALLTPSARYLAVVVMAISFVFPIKGLGVDLCILHATTGLPCPGCGLSRAISAISQGDFSTAIALNPFALLAWPLFLVLALVTLAPRSVYTRFEAWVSSHSAPIARGYRICFTAFAAFGAIRFLVFLGLGERFP